MCDVVYVSGCMWFVVGCCCDYFVFVCVVVVV